MPTSKLILASQSPRRQQLLTAMGLSYTTQVRPVDESFPPEMPIGEIANHIARNKAAAFKDDLQPGTIIITGDTIVCVDNQVLGKPKNDQEAKEMLQSFSGRSHQVISSVCLLSTEKETVASDRTTVHFRKLTMAEIDRYISQHKPFDKAGAYGIQEWIGHIAITKIEGSYNTVMGLPTHLLHTMLKDF